MGTHGVAAEHRVHDALRAALPTDYRLYANVSWLGSMRPGGPPRDGEVDLVLAHPDHGVLVLEVKAGMPSRDGQGRWWIGNVQLDRSPFEQARESKHQLVRKLESMPDWPSGAIPLAGHAVALPAVDLASLPPGHRLIGPDAPAEIVLDARALESPEGIRVWVERAFDFWLGDGSRGQPMGQHGLDVLDEVIGRPLTLRRLVRGRIADAREELVRVSAEQARIVGRLRSMRRVQIVGPAGSGKSMLAAERAGRLSAEGYRTLLVCFNQRLATTLRQDMSDAIERTAATAAPLEVTTFHRLCERWAERAGTLLARPDPIPQRWWDEMLPDALEAAIDRLPDDRFHAVVVDEGQDFDPRWFDLLQRLLRDPEDVFWVFHDPGQAIRRDDIVASLGLEPIVLFENHRNPAATAHLADRFYKGGEEIEATRPAGAPPRVVTARPGRETLDCLRRELHRLLGEEDVRPWQICVLSGIPAAQSSIWAQRRLGNAVLINEAIDDAGRSRGLPPEQVADEPTDVLFETIRRFKGLEREVVILVDLPADGPRLDELLYVAITRATTELVIICPPELAPRLQVPRPR